MVIFIFGELDEIWGKYSNHVIWIWTWQPCHLNLNMEIMYFEFEIWKYFNLKYKPVSVKVMAPDWPKSKKLVGFVALIDTASLTSSVVITTHIGSFPTSVGLDDFIIDKHQLQNYQYRSRWCHKNRPWTLFNLFRSS
jgi:hypothetical protein